MKKFDWKKLALPHFIAVIVFVVVALVYCKPALEGKVLQQEDTTQWRAMAQSSFKFKEKHGHFPLWTNSMFCGMPAYQIALDVDNPATTAFLSDATSLWLPKPANSFFLACICFYFLALVLRCNPYVAMGMALCYAYCTYNPVILIAGHETKMLAIAYLPSLIASIILVINKKYVTGTAMTAFTASLLVGANHLQITYYAVIIVAFMAIWFVIDTIRKKDLKHLFVTAGLLLFAACVGAGVHAVTLSTTSDYGKLSIRGGSVLAGETSVKGNVTKTGLSKDYAMSYSLYKTEPLAMMIPHIYGGSSGLEVDEDKSKAIEKLREMQPQMAQQLQGYLGAYWGGIGGTAGPPYIGAIICFLGLIGFVVLDDKYKWWILSACVFAIMLSWGKFFEGFNEWMLNHLPAYNKFRAPSMILVIPTFLLCMMAAMTLQKIISTENKEALWQQYKKGLYVVGGVLLAALLVYLSADYTSEGDKALLKQIGDIQDAQQKAAIMEQVKSFLNALKEDRKGLFMGDFIRSILFIAAAAAFVWMFIKNKVKGNVVVAGISLLAFVDVMNVDVKYFNNDKFSDAAEYNDANFKETPLDQQLLQDKSYYRVFDLRAGVMSSFNAGAKVAYHHNSIGGYHPAKLSIFQDLIENQLYNFPNCMPTVNMLNAKYILQQNPQTGQAIAIPNQDALGNCWFVKAVTYKKGPKAVMETLTTLKTKDSAVVDEAEKELVKYDNAGDSAASISMVKNENDLVEYQSKSSIARFAVFSEVYFPSGWKAYIDGKEATIVKTNYALRGLSIPAGEHKINFEFKPKSYYGAVKVNIVASALIWLLLAIAAFVGFKNRQKQL